MFEVDHVQDGAGKVQQEAAGMAGTDPGRAVLMGVIQADAGAGEERVSRQPCKPWFPNLQSRGGDFLSRSDDP